jgi:hypothetical protein
MRAPSFPWDGSEIPHWAVGVATPFKLPPLESAADTPKAMAAIVAAVAAGELTSAEASDLSRLVEAYVKALEAVEFDQRIRALEVSAKRDETTW